MSDAPTLPPADPDRPTPADPVELFFDLVFVFAIARLVGVIHDDLTVATAGQALLLLGMLWWAWGQFTWAASATGSDGRAVRATFLAASIATVPLAASVAGAFGEDGLLFGVGYAVVRALGLTVYAVGSPDAAHRREVGRFAALSMVAPALAVVGGTLDGSARTATWAAVLAIEVGAALASGRREFRIVPSHFAERHGLFVIVALGETIVAVGLAVSELEVGPAVIGGLLLGGTFAALLWWSYFDWAAAAAEHRLAQATGAARSKAARDIYTLGHFPIVAGIVLGAVALEAVAVHPTDPFGTDPSRIMAVAMVLLWAGLAHGAWRSTGAVPTIRIGLLVVLPAAALATASLTGLAALAILVALVAAGLVVEDRVRRPRLGTAPA